MIGFPIPKIEIVPKLIQELQEEDYSFPIPKIEIVPKHTG